MVIFLLFLNVISDAVTGNISVPVHPIQAYLEEELEQQKKIYIRKTFKIENIAVEVF